MEEFFQTLKIGINEQRSDLFQIEFDKMNDQDR